MKPEASTSLLIEPPNTRVQRTRVARCARPGSPLTRHPLGDTGDGLATRSKLGLSLRSLVLSVFCVAFLSPGLLAQSPAFACTPAINFQAVPVGQLLLRSIRCTNTQAVPVAFEYGGTVGFEDFEPNPCAGGHCYDSFPRVIPPGGGFGIVIAFHPTALGPRSGSETILNDAGLPSSVITFTGVGVAVAFGSVEVPMLDKRTELILAAGLSLVGVLLIVNGGRRVS